MSTPVGSSQWMYTPASGFYPYLIDQSLRFNDNDSAYLSRTPASTGNRKTWTWSGWVKRGNLGSYQALLGAGTTSPAYSSLRFMDTDKIQFFVGGAVTYNISTTAVYRDVPAWYHICFVFDVTETTASDRCKLYVNGVEQTLSGTFPTNSDWEINNTYPHAIGAQSVNSVFSQYFDGYMAEVNFIDGTALDATSFGETINGIWVPKQYSGSYGTNGFYLSFADSAAIGDDLSGNTNDWTANNLAASDVVPDSPTNNFATYISNDSTPVTFSEGNLSIYYSPTSWRSARSGFEVSSGKWYWEVRAGDTTYNIIGVGKNWRSELSVNNYAGITSDSYGYLADGQLFTNGAGSAYGASYTTGDIIGIALDMDAGTLEFFKNNVSQGTAATGLSGGFTPVSSVRNAKSSIANFGQDSTFAGATTAGGNADGNGYGDFAYAPPSGFLALCSANLPEPAIGPNSDTTSDQHFNTVLYTGTGAAQSITGANHAPDLLWIKRRDAVNSHILYDSVRGDWELSSNSTGADISSAGRIGSLDADGFTFENTSASALNASGGSYTSWLWKAGGTAVSNTDGSITSSVSANPDAGFSIVSYTGTGANATVGHGLASAPEMIIIKSRSSALDWPVGHTSIGFDKYLKLNTTAAQTSAAAVFNATAPTASVFSIGTNTQTNASSGNYIAYCFHSVEGFSKVGSYVGNGSADGTFVYTGFRPAWIMTKRTDSTSNWLIIDVKRDIDNVAHNRLIANSSNAEATSVVATMDILSNGFKRRDTNTDVNASGGSYIYLAFAEAPFKYANAR